jgi:hypothetical protein
VKSDRFWSVVRWNIVASLRWWHLWVTVALFVFIGHQGASQVLTIAQTSEETILLSLWDGVFVGFAGPGIADSTPLNFLRWFIPQLLFFYIIGDFGYGELAQRGHAVVPRIGSRSQWWWGKVVLLAATTGAYISIGLAAALVGARTVLPWSTTWDGSVFALADQTPALQFPTSSVTLVHWIIVSYVTSLFALAVWQTILAIFARRSFYGFIAIVASSIASWALGTNHAWLVRWLPGSQSILLRHTAWDTHTPGFSLQWTMVYNTVCIAIALGLGHAYLKRRDIYGMSSREE